MSWPTLFLRVAGFLLAIVVFTVAAFFVADAGLRSHYYDAHPLAGAMHHAANRTGTQPAYSAVLLRRIPPGTRREDVLSTMKWEGFHCVDGAVASTVRCSLSENPSPLLYLMETDWSVELTFVGESLTAASVGLWMNAP
jgi:hypothetical protein